MKVGYVARFSKTERTVHWANSLGFFLLVATGLILYLPRLSLSLALLVGHLYLALIHPATRHALRGMVREDWAREHHARWLAGD